MNIAIVNTQPIPSSGVGAASVNRILSYSKGLIKEGNNLCIYSTAVGPKGDDYVYEGVPVSHLGAGGRFVSLFRTSYNLISTLRRKRPDILLFVTSNYFLIILLELYARLSKVIIVNERSEYPFVVMSKSRLKRLIAPLYVNTAYRMLDGMILMTKPLMQYYRDKVSKHCVFLEVPMTVDTSRFVVNEKKMCNQLNDSYIAYCGNMGGNKDGIENLLKSFSIVEKRGYPLKLLLIGGTNNKVEYEKLILLNKNLGNQNVVFYGKATRNEMPSLLGGAKILALSRPSSIQSTGGFPTKLGEYLATGNPVVVTSVGDIPLYLHDKENAYVVPPDDINSFADAICNIWDHYSEAKLVGEKGRHLATTIFNGEFQAKRIDSFLKTLVR